VICVHRGAGHPWSGRAGFDLLYVTAGTAEELQHIARNAERKFWHAWILGEKDGVPAGVLYKPSGIRADWVDEPDRPRPGGELSGADEAGQAW